MKRRLRLLAVIMSVAMTATGQKLQFLNVRNTTDTGCYMVGTRDSAGVFTTYRFPVSSLGGGGHGNSPGGSFGNIQIDSAGYFFGSNNLNHSGSIFTLGFGGNIFLIMDAGGDASFTNDSSFGVKDGSGNGFLNLDLRNRHYSIGNNTAGFVANSSMPSGADTINGHVTIPALGGSGTGVV